MRKGFKNQYTKIAVTKTVGEIEDLVVKRMKASSFFKEYWKDGRIKSVVFVIPTDKGTLAFKLPARVEQVEKIIGNKEQAERTAWRNIKDWVDAQLALIETEQVEVTEVFLPYLTDSAGRTMYEKLEKGGFQLGAGK